MYKVLQIGVILSLFLCIIFFIPAGSYAQNSGPNVSISATLKSADQKNATVGHIVGKDSSGYYITKSSNDPHIIGVVAEQPNILYTYTDPQNYTTIAVEGITDVLVSTQNGAITYGDYITSSSSPGVGMKADNQSSIIGTALEPLSAADSPKLIKVQLDLSRSPITPPKVGLINQLKNAASRVISNIEFDTSKNFTKSFLYFAALVVIVLANILGFRNFGRIAIKGIDAVGRNPLAKRSILLATIANVIMTILFTLGSIIVALIILRW